MLIHTYFTNGFFENARVFLKSLHYVHRDNLPEVWMDTRGLTRDEVNDLISCYPDGKITVNSMPLPMQDWAKRAGLPVEVMETYKNECEKMYIQGPNRVWKLMTSGDDRWRSVYKILWSKKYEYIAHFDIDTLFRKPLINVVHDLLDKKDIWFKLRLWHKVVKARITTDCVLVRPADSLKRFFDRWRYHIDRVPPIERPVGWGQGSCWHAFEECKKEMRYDCLPLEFGLPSGNKPSNYVWNGNVHLLRKDDCAVMFGKELDKWKKSGS